jgi:DNA replication and repair protein RecF
LIIEDLKLIGFRNLKQFQASFCKNKNLIHGNNGAGKTSILEAIFLLGYGKSFLNVKKSDILNENSHQFSLHLIAANPYGRKNSISASYKEIFSLFLNNKKSDIFEINNYLYPIIFSSSNYNLYIESKTYIRKLLDRFIFGIDSLYIHYLLSYNKALKQKNHLLKTKQNIDEITSWNKIISEMSEKIVDIKIKFIDMLNKKIKSKFDNDLGINYIPSFDIDTRSKEKNISKMFFFEQLEKRKPSEMIYKRSVIGPHLDHFHINLSNKNLKYYSSGEKKINLLMIYIAFIELFKGLKNEYPVFLIDDFDTAIDEENIDFLIKSYPELQMIATSVNKRNGFDQFIELKKEN